MKMIITENDVKNLSGKFALQLKHEESDVILNDSNWLFMEEKRLFFISGLTICPKFAYWQETFENEEAFVKYWNNTKGRFHRLLTNAELDFLLKKLKEQNY